MSLLEPIVLTRDVSANLKTKYKILEKIPNADVILAPVRHVEKIDHGAVQTKKFDAIILTSANGVNYYDYDLPALPIYCVGENTALAARQKNGKVVGVFLNLAALSEALQRLPHTKFMHIHGDPTSANLGHVAALKHHEFEKVICYKGCHKVWTKTEHNRIEQTQNAIFPVFSYASALSLTANLESLASHFCAKILPISFEVSMFFDKNSKITLLPYPKEPNLRGVIDQIMPQTRVDIK